MILVEFYGFDVCVDWLIIGLCYGRRRVIWLLVGGNYLRGVVSIRLCIYLI